jgi:hypothetical protein
MRENTLIEELVGAKQRPFLEENQPYAEDHV